MTAQGPLEGWTTLGFTDDFLSLYGKEKVKGHTSPGEIQGARSGGQGFYSVNQLVIKMPSDKSWHREAARRHSRRA